MVNDKKSGLAIELLFVMKLPMIIEVFAIQNPYLSNFHAKMMYRDQDRDVPHMTHSSVFITGPAGSANPSREPTTTAARSFSLPPPQRSNHHQSRNHRRFGAHASVEGANHLAATDARPLPPPRCRGEPTTTIPAPVGVHPSRELTTFPPPRCREPTTTSAQLSGAWTWTRRPRGASSPSPVGSSSVSTAAARNNFTRVHPRNETIRDELDTKRRNTLT
jgi:hypothetical protein